MNIKKVAEQAGVSITTVSRVLNNPDMVSETTKNKVLQVMKELNYTPNWFAQNLQNRRTNVIGLLIPDTMDQSNMEIAKGVEKVARQKQCNIILCNTEYDIAVEKNQIDTLLKRQIDGLILISSSLPKTDIKKLHAKSANFVLVDRIDCSESENTVYTNYTEASEEAMVHFAGMGRKKIALILAEQPEVIESFKLDGYKNALKKQGLPFDPDMVIKSENSIEGGLIAAGKLLERKDRPDAIFVSRDIMAFGVLERIRQAGLSPAEMGVIGFDDLEIGGVMEPKLTTVTKPSYRMGLTAARLLFDMLEDEDLADKPQSIMLQSKLKIRKSCGNTKRLKEIW